MSKPDMQEEIDSIVSPLLARHKHIGLVIGFINGDDTTVYGYGKVGAHSAQVPDAKTFFELGSITKVFTSLLLASMVVNGLVSLDEPVSGLLPEFPNLPPEITLLRLATHTSGLPRLPSNLLWLAAIHPRNPYAKYSAARLHAYLARYRPKRPSPQSPAYAYSNLGAGLLGYALGRKLGIPYQEAVISRICEPLGMHDTRFVLSPEQRQRLATPHTAKGQPTSNWDFLALAGAGALRSTVSDMLTFLAANLGRLRTPLQPALDLCHKIYVEKPLPENSLLGVALAWHVSQLEETEHPLYWHNGATGGYRTFTGFLKGGQNGVVVLSNYGFGGKADIDGLGIEVLKAIYSSYSL